MTDQIAVMGLDLAVFESPTEATRSAVFSRIQDLPTIEDLPTIDRGPIADAIAAQPGMPAAIYELIACAGLNGRDRTRDIRQIPG